MKQTFEQRKLLLMALFAVSLIIAFLAWNGFGLFFEPTHLVTTTHSIFRNACHQNPARTFIIDGTLLPVCGRCLGIYSAIPFGILLLSSTISFKKSYDRKTVVKMVMIVSLFLLSEVVLEMLDFIQVGNIFRFSTGFIYVSLLSVLVKSIK